MPVGEWSGSMLWWQVHHPLLPVPPTGEQAYKLLIERALGASNYRTERTVSHLPEAISHFDPLTPLCLHPCALVLVCCVLQMACDIRVKAAKDSAET